MKTTSFFLAGLLASAATMLSPIHSQAAVSAAQGDLVLAFRTADLSKPYNLEIDLGSAQTFTTWATSNAGTTISLNYGSSGNPNYLGSTGGLAPGDLATVFGSNWNSDPDLVFSIAGAGTGISPTLWATFSPGTTPPRKTGSQQKTAGDRMLAIIGGLNGQDNVFDTGSNTPGYTPAALISPQAVGLNNGDEDSYSTAITDGNDYGYFANKTEAAVPSTGTSVLNLYRLAPGSGAGQNLGFFTLGDTGSLTFTAAPEPGSAMLLGVSAMALLFRRRRAVQA